MSIHWIEINNMFSVSTKLKLKKLKKKKKKKEKTTKRDKKANLLVCDASLLFRGIWKSLFCFGVSSTGPLYAKEVQGGKACNYS